MDPRQPTCLIVPLLLLLVSILVVEAAPDFDPSSRYSGICKKAKYQDFCLGFAAAQNSVTTRADDLVAKAMVQVKHQLQGLVRSCKSFQQYQPSSKLLAALSDCSTVLGGASDLMDLASSRLNDDDPHKLEDVHTWMSAALTYYATCMDGLDEIGVVGRSAASSLKQGITLDKYMSTALAIIQSMYSPGQAKKMTDHDDSSSWWFFHGRELAEVPAPVPNVTVAQDGSGQFSNISAAIAATPVKSQTRYVIYVKEGVYNETVVVPKSAANITLVGDGIRKTIITGNKSVQDPNVTTFSSATVIIQGPNFQAQGITIQNTAGAISHQAVALRVSADKAAFYKCSFEGFQDTLYAHNFRQFYSQCRIYGTVDFIFGNAAAVFYQSELVARVPLAQQKNTYTAQGREDPNQNTAFSFQDCTVDGNDDLKQQIQSFPTYLGRPWKEYSRTVYLNCYEGDVINPAGWLEWNGEFALSTLFYGEYLPQGPGSGSSQRVSWSTQITNQTLANQFSARNLLAGQDWLPRTGYPMQLDV